MVTPILYDYKISIIQLSKENYKKTACPNDTKKPVLVMRTGFLWFTVNSIHIEFAQQPSYVSEKISPRMI